MNVNEILLQAVPMFCTGVVGFAWGKCRSLQKTEKAEDLLIGATYVLGDGRNPYQACRVVIVDISHGYVAYHYLLDGREVGQIQSLKAPWFAEMYSLTGGIQ